MKLISLHHLKQRNNSQKKQMLPATKLFLLKLQLNPNRKQIINPKFSLHIFSATGTTRPIAEEIANVTGGDLFEIVPVQPYSEEDLDYSNDNCRANQEQNDDTARPEISDTIENIDEYDVVFIGHPIWWGIEPRIIDTFLESYDFSGKTMVDFCTSGGSGISESESNLKEICPDSVWLEGKRFLESSSHDDIADWVDNMNF